MRVLLVLSTFAVGIESGATTLKDCVNLDGEVSYLQPPIVRLDADYKVDLENYQTRMKDCEALRNQVECDKRSRASRTDAIFYSLARGGLLKVSTADLSAAEVICSRQN